MFSKDKNKGYFHFVSFPKSGRTWIELMVAKAYSIKTGTDVSTIVNNKADFTDTNLSNYFFSHGHENNLICKGNYFPVKNYYNKKVILLVRDPRSVLVSMYYYMKYSFNAFGGDISEFIKYPYKSGTQEAIVSSSRFGIMPIINYMNAWKNNNKILKDFKVIYYEDFKKNTKKELTKLLRYVGLHFCSNEIDLILEYGSIDNMKKLESENTLKWHAFPNPQDNRGAKVREGNTTGFKKELSLDDLKYIEDMLENNLNNFYKRYKYYSCK